MKELSESKKRLQDIVERRKRRLEGDAAHIRYVVRLAKDKPRCRAGVSDLLKGLRTVVKGGIEKCDRILDRIPEDDFSDYEADLLFQTFEKIEESKDR